MPFGRKSPLEALALPGVILAYKYSQFRQRRREAASRRVTERELAALHHKIDKLLNKLEESEPDPPTSQEDECVICINARATMQTSPCGHRVVCRRCFVKTIQSAVAQRLLPLRCVICRARVNRLTSSSGTWRIQESASCPTIGDVHSGHHSFHPAGRYSRSPNGRVAQSASLYSMSSTGSSSMSGVSHSFSKTSSFSSGLSSPGSPISPAVNVYTQTVIHNNHLAPPTPSISQHSSTSPSGSGSSGSGSLSPRDLQHSHHSGCPSGCSGAIPRKPLHSLSNSSSSGSCSSAGSASSSGGGNVFFSSSTHTYPGRRFAKGRLLDLHNRLPPIKEFRSPAKVPHPSPVHVSNPRFRYASYTKTSVHEMAPLMREPPSPPRRPMNIQFTSSLTLAPPPLKATGAKIAPITAKNAMPKNAYQAPKDKKSHSAGNVSKIPTAAGSNVSSHGGSLSAGKKPLLDASATAMSLNVSASVASKSPRSPRTNNASNRSFPLFASSNNHKEKADNKKNESVERKKKDEKLKLKAEKEARKEEKRLAKEEERLTKLMAKEEKKRGKKEAKELLLANDGNNKK